MGVITQICLNLKISLATPILRLHDGGDYKTKIDMDTISYSRPDHNAGLTNIYICKKSPQG